MHFSTSFIAAAALAFSTSVTAAPTAGTAIAQGVWSDAFPNPLATFNVYWYNLKVPGFYMDTWGNYNTCYNFAADAPYTQGVGSIAVDGTQTQGCRAYPNADCQGDSTQILPPGNSLYTGHVKSFYCAPPKTA
ncbi:hypothetical protein GLAREA_12376 [Glarea lozoyensis ATCC 20868]|uniref:Uncharacterized protein n=2 Tax=Glarea lozoyensis TaxID=101852 RepID=S3D188_GLAL2|nr:uncharacterized protein GLAREA_12376 [Glarea lozoyensis ATCC 20868]EHL02456.1 hypothetical protein M7I_1536 [Glarea lozoyensis 74030]EPE31620.1 hypothetical protein GLAREA_12376 [Glarea lozoyensis ATCC 20868]